jgi:hypothetical protein
MVDGCNDDMVAVIKFILVMDTEYWVSRQGIEIPLIGRSQLEYSRRQIGRYTMIADE